ncbi:hypothetical protein, partial [Pseudomonas chlororaphis]
IHATFAGLVLLATPLAHADGLYITGHILPGSCATEQHANPASFNLNACPEQASRARIEVIPVSSKASSTTQLQLLETTTDSNTHNFTRTYQIIEPTVDLSSDRTYLVSVIYP